MDAAISSGEIPPDLVEPLVRRVAAIGTIGCVRPTPSPTVKESDGDSKDQGRGKKKHGDD